MLCYLTCNFCWVMEVSFYPYPYFMALRLTWSLSHTQSALYDWMLCGSVAKHTLHAIIYLLNWKNVALYQFISADDPFQDFASCNIDTGVGVVLAWSTQHGSMTFLVKFWRQWACSVWHYVPIYTSRWQDLSDHLSSIPSHRFWWCRCCKDHFLTVILVVHEDSYGHFHGVFID